MFKGLSLPSLSAFDASTRVVRKCSQEFEQVKFQRCQRFNRCFEHVSVVIDHIYKRLCRNSSAQVLLSTPPSHRGRITTQLC